MSDLASRNLRDPAKYVPDDDAVAAVEVARILRQPLLVTGAPGIGKSSLAEWVALTEKREFISFTAKSTTVATDLLYRFDAVRHFRAEQIAAARGAETETPAAPYLRFQALGRAIALTYRADQIAMKIVWDEGANRLPDETLSRRTREGYGSVVLIDEIDKAPRDVPNDLLVEFEKMSFLVPEANQALSVQDSRLHPIVIATSNSEKSLPDAFLRRCIFLHLSTPTGKTLKEIIRNRLPAVEGTAAEADAVAMFEAVHTEDDHAPYLRRRPSTAELIGLLQFAAVVGPRADWFRAKGLASGLQAMAADGGGQAFGQFLSILFKTQDDLRAGREWLCKQWTLPPEYAAAERA